MTMGIFLSKYSRFERTLPDVTGKVFAITGTTSGTGFVAAKTVAKHGGEVVLLNRPSMRSVASLEKLRAEVPGATFVPIDCDLMDLASVRKAAKEIRSKYKVLYCLSNNAGIMATPDEITKDGFDKQMQTNHISHFLLTKELFPMLKASVKECGDARVVQHSSIARDGTKDNLLGEEYLSKQLKDGCLGGDEGNAAFAGPAWERYCQTKLANSVFCQALHRKLSESKDENARGILSVCAHPGLSQTNLGNHLADGASVLKKSLFWLYFALLNQSAEDGSMGLIKGMMESRGTVESGVLYGPPGAGMYGWAVGLPSKEYETDPKNRELLWKKSEEAIGVNFDL